MPKPLGEKIFSALNLQDSGFYQDGTLEQGVCAAATCHWIAETIKNGVLTSIDMIGTRWKIELSQAAHEFGHSSDESDEKNRQALVEACGLHVVSRKVTAAPESEAVRRSIAEKDLGVKPPAPEAQYFWVGLRREGGGHAVGVHVVPNGDVYLFDANYGLFRSRSDQWSEDFEHLLTKVYTKEDGVKYRLPARITKVAAG